MNLPQLTAYGFVRKDVDNVKWSLRTIFVQLYRHKTGVHCCWQHKTEIRVSQSHLQIKPYPNCYITSILSASCNTSSLLRIPFIPSSFQTTVSVAEDDAVFLASATVVTSPPPLTNLNRSWAAILFISFLFHVFYIDPQTKNVFKFISVLHSHNWCHKNWCTVTVFYRMQHPSVYCAYQIWGFCIHLTTIPDLLRGRVKWKH